MNQFNTYPYTSRITQQSNLDWIMVQNIDQVEAIAVQPNSKAWIMVQNEPVFALRQCDSMGLAKTEFYRFEKFEPHPAPEYITRDEFKKILTELKEGGSNESTNIERKATNKPVKD